MPKAFYELIAPDRVAATSATAGPWDPGLSHGSPPAALLLRAIETAFPRPDARVGRIAIDFFGPVPVAELTVSAERLRPGARIELSRAQLAVPGRTVLQATAWRIATSPGRVPDVPDERDVPPLPAPQAQRLFADAPSFGYGEAMEWRFVDGAFHLMGPATVYARPRIPLIAGEPVSPLGRLLLLVDSANGVSAALSPARYTFVPVELTVSVTRYPRTEWVGMRARTTIHGDGVGQSRAELFDEAGFLGTALQTLFVAPR